MGACATKPSVLKDGETEGGPAPEVMAEESPATLDVKEVAVIDTIVAATTDDDIKPRSLSNFFQEVGEVIKETTGAEPSVEPEIKDEKSVVEKLKTETNPVQLKQDIEKTIISEEEKVPVNLVVVKEKEPVEEKPKTETKAVQVVATTVEVKPTTETKAVDTKPVQVVEENPKTETKAVDTKPVQVVAKEKEPAVVEIKAAIATEVKPSPVEVKPKPEIVTKPAQVSEKTEGKPATVAVANEKK